MHSMLCRALFVTVMIAASRLLCTIALHSRGKQAPSFLVPTCRRVSSALGALSPDQCISAFDKIKNDEVTLTREAPGKKAPIKRVSIDFGMLNRYAEELNAVLANAAFMGVTHIPIKRQYVEDKPLDAALLHFRGFEKGDSLCLHYQRESFPLIPSPSARYEPPSERTLYYFETVMSGLSGLRVSRVHCPFFFKNVIAIDLQPPHCYSSGPENEGNQESYRILVVAKGSGNRLVVTDNTDGVILLTSETFDEKSGIRDGVGSVFQVEASRKATPDPTEPYEAFCERFKGKEHMSLLKAMIMTYEALDARRVTYLAGKAGVDPSVHVSKIDNLADFYASFIRWLRYPIESSEHLAFVLETGKVDLKDKADGKPDNVSFEDSDTSGNDMSDKTVISHIFHHWGSTGPVYQHQRLAEDSKELIEKTLNRLERVREQCIGDEQQAERLAKVNERLQSISEYEKALSTAMKWKSPETFDLVKTIYQQVWELGDLTGYRKKANEKPFAPPRVTADDGGRNVSNLKVKKENPYKGILVLKTHPQNPDTALIIVGRNAKQNEHVTHELAQKGDIWLHTKDCPGSHVLLRRGAGNQEALQIAADIAVYYSKAKKLMVAPVIKTGIENVKKCEDAKLGAVLVSQFETIQGRPDRGGEYVKAHRISLS